MTQDNPNTQASQQAPDGIAALKRLDGLVGEWRIEIAAPFEPHTVVRGRAAIEWLQGGAFLIQRTDIDHAAFPHSIALIGWDADAATYAMHYFDSRGVIRIYAMSLTGGIWKAWRDAPGFSQRFTGKISENGGSIAAFWEKSTDGAHWEHDFDMTYTRA